MRIRNEEIKQMVSSLTDKPVVISKNYPRVKAWINDGSPVNLFLAGKDKNAILLIDVAYGYLILIEKDQGQNKIYIDYESKIVVGKNYVGISEFYTGNNAILTKKVK